MWIVQQQCKILPLSTCIIINFVYTVNEHEHRFTNHKAMSGKYVYSKWTRFPILIHQVRLNLNITRILKIPRSAHCNGCTYYLNVVEVHNYKLIP
jgi:hypothetical protein